MVMIMKDHPWLLHNVPKMSCGHRLWWEWGVGICKRCEMDKLYSAVRYLGYGDASRLLRYYAMDHVDSLIEAGKKVEGTMPYTFE